VLESHHGGNGAERGRDLLGDGREHLLRLDSFGDQGGDAPQRLLLRAEAAQLVVRLRVRDGRRDQVRERGQPHLGAGGKRLRPLCGDEHDAPNATFDYDRRRD